MSPCVHGDLLALPERDRSARPSAAISWIFLKSSVALGRVGGCPARPPAASSIWRVDVVVVEERRSTRRTGPRSRRCPGSPGTSRAGRPGTCRPVVPSCTLPLGRLQVDLEQAARLELTLDLGVLVARQRAVVRRRLPDLQVDRRLDTGLREQLPRPWPCPARRRTRPCNASVPGEALAGPSSRAGSTVPW